MKKPVLRSGSALEKVLRSLPKTGLPRSLAAVVLRRELAAVKADGKIPVFEDVVSNVRDILAALRRARTRSVVNGTGIFVPVALNRYAVRAAKKVSTSVLRKRAERIKLALEAMPMKTSIGSSRTRVLRGGSPAFMTSVTLELEPLTMSVMEIARRLRTGTPPVVGYVADQRFKIDVRTVLPYQDERLFRAIYKVFGVW